TGATTAQTLFAAISGGNPGIRLELGSDGKSRYLHRFPAGGSGGTEIVSRRAYNDNTWHHLAAVKSGGSLTLYVDGVTVGAANDGSAPNYALNVALGQNFNGLLDEVQVYNRALTVSDIRSLAQDKVAGVKQVEVAFTPIGSDSAFNEPPEGQLLHLPLDDSPDKDGNLKFQDLSGNKHDGACSGDDCPTTGIPGHSGSAARFDNNDRISVPLDTPQGPFTLAAWVKFTGSDMTDRTIMEFGDGALRLRADGGKFNLYSTATQPVRSCRTYVSSDTPVPIHGGFPYGLATSTIDVPDGFIVDDVNLTLNISYTVDRELSTYLKAPNGTSVSLFSGLGGDGDNFTNTVLDDEAAQAITAGSPPFTGRFKPQSALSAVDGQSSQGAWQLGVLTQGIVFGTGALQSWLLQLCGTFVPPSNVVSGGAVSAGQWAHVAYTWDGIYSRLYVNGVLVTSNTAPPRQEGKGLVIGKHTGQGWQGLIDDVRVFNRALEANEILRTTGPLLVLPFDEAWATDGATLADTSGWERQATLHSPGDWPSNKNRAVNGQVGAHALQFNGYRDHVNAGSGIDLAGKSFTAAFWARQDDLGGTRDKFIIGQGDSRDYSHSLGIGFRDNNKFTCAFLYNDLDTSTAYTDTDWHHWACTYDAATNKRTIYRDGVQVAQDTAAADYEGSGELFVGKSPLSLDHFLFQGAVDDVRIYPRALSELEVQALAQSDWRVATYPAQSLAQSAQHVAAPATAPGCRTYSSSDTPVAINDNQTATSRITVPDDFTVDDVNLTLNINHTWDGDLLGYLITPDGTQVVLFNRIGGSGDDFTNTTLDDEANEIIPGYGAPYSGNYRPQSPLSAVDGQSSLGTWQFKVSDNAWGDQGTIQDWQLELCSSTPPSPPFDWSYDVPAGLEGNYRIDLRGTDKAGLPDNSNNSRDLWRGIIDTLAPRVSITRTMAGSKYRYTTVARDLNLGEQGFLSPCGAGVVKDRAYVDRGAGSGPQLIRLTAICDLGSTSTVAEVGAYDTPGYAYDVAVSGDPSAGSGQAYAYVADGARGLRVVDISNPSSPREVGAYDTPGSANGVAVSGDPSAGSGQAYAYVTWESTDDFSSGGGLRVVDVSNPASPRQVGAYDVPAGNPKDVAVSGGYAYVAWEPGDPWGFGGGGNGGLYVLDVSNPAGPHQVGTYDTPGGANSVAVSGDPSAGSGQAYAYVTWVFEGWPSSRSGLHVVDISNPASPRQVGVYSTPDSATSVAVSGTYAYVIWSDPTSFFPGSGGSGLRIVDISNPASPRQAGAYDISEKPGADVATAGTYVYITEGDSTFPSEDGGLRVLDASNPASPHEVGFYSTPGGNALGVAALGNYAYVADGQKGLRVAQYSSGSATAAEAATACDVFGQCTTATLPPATRNAVLTAQATRVETPTTSLIVSAPPLLESTNPITITGFARATDYLQALTVTVSSRTTPLYAQTWASGAVTQTLFSLPWTPAGEGEHVFTAQASDWLTGTATFSTTVIVDTVPPAISIATDVLTSTHYATSGQLDITG
ncbi:MAG: LamG-like jellyroll fold domain-containing protein, partial [Anaerolineae bacterium]